MKSRWWEPWTPVVAVVIAALLGLVGYSYERSLDRAADLQKLKREAYTIYLEALQYTLDGMDTDISGYGTAVENLLLIASDDVLRIVGLLHMTLAEVVRRGATEDDMKRVFDMMTDMYRAMRDDGFYPIALSDEEVAALIEALARYRWISY